MKNLPAPWSPTCRRRRCRGRATLSSAQGYFLYLGESYTLPENLFLAYQRTGSLYREWLSATWEDDTYSGRCPRATTSSPSTRYSHVNAFSSAMQAYLTLGSEMHLRAARNGFDMSRPRRALPPADGVRMRPSENPGGQLGNSLVSTMRAFETPCGAYGHFKITRYLLRVTKEHAMATAWNSALQHPSWGPGRSSLTVHLLLFGLQQHRQEVWYRDKWPCCSGTFPQLAADYHISTTCGLRWASTSICTLPPRCAGRQRGKYSLTQATKYPLKHGGDPGFGQPGGGVHHLPPHPALGRVRYGAFRDGKRTSEAATPALLPLSKRTWQDATA